MTLDVRILSLILGEGFHHYQIIESAEIYVVNSLLVDFHNSLPLQSPDSNLCNKHMQILSKQYSNP